MILGDLNILKMAAIWGGESQEAVQEPEEMEIFVN